MRKYMKKTDEARLQGMQMAYKIAKEKGIDELENELKWRCKNNVSLPVSRTDLTEVARALAYEEFMIMSISMAVTITEDMHMPPSLTKEFMTSFSKRIDTYRLDAEKLKKDTEMLENDYAMIEMLKKYTEERNVENE